jgi:hypothetical protein
MSWHGHSRLPQILYKLITHRRLLEDSNPRPSERHADYVPFSYGDSRGRVCLPHVRNLATVVHNLETGFLHLQILQNVETVLPISGQYCIIS